jgi:hypothetical protein
MENQISGRALQRLNTGHLVDRDGPHTLLRDAGSELIYRTDIGALGVKVGIRLGRQPVAATVWLEIGCFFKNRPTEPCEMLLTMPPGPPIGGPIRFGSND